MAVLLLSIEIPDVDPKLVDPKEQAEQFVDQFNLVMGVHARRYAMRLSNVIPPAWADDERLKRSDVPIKQTYYIQPTGQQAALANEQFEAMRKARRAEAGMPELGDEW